MMKKVTFHTLGCKLNYAETETLIQSFTTRGYRQVNLVDKPDIFIINTCSVTENADVKCNRLVRAARRISPHAYIALVGCYAQLGADALANMPGVNAVVGTKDKFRLVELLNNFTPQAKPVIHHTTIERETAFNPSYAVCSRTRAFLKVQDGCSYSCSFCTIPLARGKSRSNTINDTVTAAKNIADTGAKEIVLTGVNIGDFGMRHGARSERFTDLVRALDDGVNIERFRISSIEPNLLTDEIIDVVARSKRFVPHFHIPLQSGSNKILRMMRRRYLRELYRQKIERIKTLMPTCCIGVDVMVGFPGEGRKEFMETHAFLSELDVSYLHVFTYSERRNTPATRMEGTVGMEERNNRSNTLRMLSEKKRRSFYEAQVGKHAHVLFENDIKNGRIYGLTNNYIRTSVNCDSKLVNTIKPVILQAVDRHGVMRAKLVPQVKTSRK